MRVETTADNKVAFVEAEYSEELCLRVIEQLSENQLESLETIVIHLRKSL